MKVQKDAHKSRVLRRNQDSKTSKRKVSCTSKCDHLRRIKRTLRALGMPTTDVKNLSTAFLQARTRSGKLSCSPFQDLACAKGTTTDCFCVQTVQCKYAAYVTAIDANKTHFQTTGHRLGCCRQYGKAVGLYCFNCAEVIEFIPKVSSSKSVAPLALRDANTNKKDNKIRNTSRRVLPKRLGLLPKVSRRSRINSTIITTTTTTTTTVHCRGLVNLGKTCYMNSIFQILIHTPAISDHFIHNASEEIRTCQDENNLTACFYRLLCEFLKNNSNAITPKQIVGLIKEKMDRFRENKENDAHEFFSEILNTLDTELLLLQRADATNSSLIDRTFQGCLESKVSCGVCGKSRTRDESFRDIPLQVVSEDSPENVSWDLPELLGRFTQVEHMNGVQCPNCERRTQSTRQIRFKMLPSVVCIQLKRFAPIQEGSKYSITKIKTKVSFPDCIDFSRFKCEPGKDIYSLHAVVSHCGKRYESGHYRTHLRKLGNWICLNDATVENLRNKPKTLDSEAYLLFYIKEN